MRGYTIEEAWPMFAYYSKRQLEKLYAGRETLTALDFLELPLPYEDKLFILLRPEVIPERENELLACAFAERVAHFAGSPKACELLRVKRLWIDGKATDEELAMAKRDAMIARAGAALPEAGAAWGAIHAAAAASRGGALETSVWAADAVTCAVTERSPAKTADAKDWETYKAACAARAEARAAERKAQLDLAREVIERLSSNAEDSSPGTEGEPSSALLS